MTEQIPTERWDAFEKEVLEPFANNPQIFVCGACACVFIPQPDSGGIYPDRWVPETDVFHECKCHEFESPFDE